jgi:methionine synthase II (cobalamin-independent)
MALAQAGALIVQIDEPALARIGRDDGTERALAAEAFRRLTAGAPDLHLMLAVMYGSAEDAGARLLFDAPFHSYLFDLCAGPDSWRLVSRAPGDRGIVAGVADARLPHRESKEILIWGARYAAALNGRGLERVGLAPSADLLGLTHAQARAKIAAVGEAARLAALSDPDDLRRSLDPRSVDIRSAAVGRYDPTVDRIPGRRRRSRQSRDAP